MNTGNHTGGRDSVCLACSLTPHKKLQRCKFYNKDGTLTRYAFSCGYIETHGNNNFKNLSMRHGVFHVDGQDENGNFVNKSFDKVKPARAFLRARAEDEQITMEAT